MNAPLLQVDDLRVSLDLRAGRVHAVEGMSLQLRAGETLAIVGESGCGKTLAALALMRLLPQPPANITAGRVRLDGRDLVSLDEAQMRRVRGPGLAMIFQDPIGSLNPVHTIGTQLVEALHTHGPAGVDSRQTWQQARQLLEDVRIPNAEARLHDYPHRLSGGMAQRVMIALALAARPRVLIADEPTTALDVTIQAQILRLLKQLQRERGMGLLIITHDLGVVAEVADRVLVMYAGRMAEQSPVERLFDHPLHPYTQGLLAATPAAGQRPGSPLSDIPGQVPELAALPVGCAFAGRCPCAFARCRQERPQLQPLGGGQSVACFAAQSVSIPGRTLG